MLHNTSSHQIEKVLDSLADIKRAEASPFFYTQVISRLEHIKSSIWERVGVILSKPSVAFTCVCMILIINIFAIFSQKSTPRTNINDLVAADEYTQVSNSYYDFENPKP